MNLFFKFVVTMVLVALLLTGLLSVLSALISRVSLGSFPRLEDPDRDEAEYDEHEMLVSGRERDRAALS